MSSLLVDRCNVSGGCSSVLDTDGTELLDVTLSEPGSLLVGDDRRTVHGVSPVRARDGDRPAWRDVLVATLVPPGGLGRVFAALADGGIRPGSARER
ncbi:hypothetical protein GCM10020295_75710 [Streptomyces cinereospinus]